MNKSNSESIIPQPPDRETATVVRIEGTSPFWRLLAVAALFGSLFAFGTWTAELGQWWLDNVSMVITLTIVTTIRLVVQDTPDAAIKRFGPFSKVAAAVVESKDEIQEFLDRRVMALRILIAFFLAIGTVVLKIIVSAFLSSVASPWLAGGLGLLIGSAVALPQLYLPLLRALNGSTSGSEK